MFKNAKCFHLFLNNNITLPIYDSKYEWARAKVKKESGHDEGFDIFHVWKSGPFVIVDRKNSNFVYLI